MKRTRQEKPARLQEKAAKANAYLAARPRAKAETALRKLQAVAAKLKLPRLAVIAGEGRTLTVVKDPAGWHEAAKPDGCCVLKTDLPRQEEPEEQVHARYKDLAKVEQTFRESKTAHLEMRPVHVRLADRTRAHAPVVRRAYRIRREPARCRQGLDVTVERALNEPSTWCGEEVLAGGLPAGTRLPPPREPVRSDGTVQAAKAVSHSVRHRTPKCAPRGAAARPERPSQAAGVASASRRCGNIPPHGRDGRATGIAVPARIPVSRPRASAERKLTSRRKSQIISMLYPATPGYDCGHPF